MPDCSRTLRILVTTLWVAVAVVGWTGDVAAERRAELQALTNRQPQLLGRTLALLQPTPGDLSRLYFVGFAGHGDEAVFKREVLAVRELFDDRFGTKGGSIALINHPSTADDVPLADIANLDEVLQHIGKVMDRWRDTLFLFLTSHGEKGVLAVKMPGLALRQLRPARLKMMLDRSGINKRLRLEGKLPFELAPATSGFIPMAKADVP